MNNRVTNKVLFKTPFNFDVTATDNLLRDAKPLSGNARNASAKDVNIIVCFRRGAKNHTDHVDNK